MITVINEILIIKNLLGILFTKVLTFLISVEFDRFVNIAYKTKKKK